MRYSSIVNIAATTWKRAPHLPLYLSGPPGVGKTSLAYSVADKLDIPHDKVVIFRPSLRDPVDLMGGLDTSGEFTRWKPPYELGRLREGRWLLVIDELPQANKQMQNALAGLMLDRFVGELSLSDDVYVMATGNRTQDKAGSGRLVSQLGNRVLHLEQEVHLDDWCEWAMTQDGLDIMGVAFMRFRPDALFDFDPDRLSNATPRSWEKVMRLDADAYDPGDFYEMLTGLVNEGRASEYIGFRNLLGRVPNIDQIQMDPMGAMVPTEPDVLYAAVAALVTRANDTNWGAFCQYVSRLPQDYSVLFMKGAVRKNEKFMSTKEYIDWAVSNQAVFSA